MEIVRTIPSGRREDPQHILELPSDKDHTSASVTAEKLKKRRAVVYLTYDHPDVDESFGSHVQQHVKYYTEANSAADLSLLCENTGRSGLSSVFK